MKTLVSTIALLVTITATSFAQTKAHSNHIELTTSLEYDITVVSWETFNEANTSYFLIEKSTDGITFKKIGKQVASGSSNKVNSYTFEDLSVDSVLVQYRITLICMDGSSFASNTATSYPSNIAQVDTNGEH